MADNREGRCPTTDVNFLCDPVRCTLPAGHDEPCGGARGGKWAPDELFGQYRTANDVRSQGHDGR